MPLSRVRTIVIRVRLGEQMQLICTHTGGNAPNPRHFTTIKQPDWWVEAGTLHPRHSVLARAQEL